MGQLTVTKTIPFSAERVWESLSSFGDVYLFHPAVQRSPLLSEASGGVGARRRCEFHDGNHVVEEIVGWDEGRSLDVEITEGSMPIARALARLEVTPIDESHSEVSMAMDYTPKYGPIGALMDVLMMKRMFRGMIGRVLDGLSTHLATGGVVGQDGQVAVASAA